ncbi:MAG: PD40 domain-containing protein [Verrucomicrobiae bacterium]|nr:PD40 domain-containing protein [Verrucomicrobiae bacterium]
MAPIRLASSPALSPDGSRIVFSWAGDLWICRSRGGTARQLTAHPAYESNAAFSPDGESIAFTSNRTGQDQVHVMPVRNGIPRQITFHSEGSRLVEWYPDGRSVLIEGVRDFGTRSASRFFRVQIDGRHPESPLFDAEGHSGSLSPDGKKLLFCREGGDLYRKGYRGTRASQIWLAEGLETDKPTFRQLIARATGARSPMWKPDGSGFYYLGDHGSGKRFDVWERDLASGKESALTNFEDDPAIGPAISRDGSVIVFRKAFDFQRLALGTEVSEKARLRSVDLQASADTLPEREVRRLLNRATNVAFSGDGLEMVFSAGGDLWAMDTELREPIPVTRTPEEEREPVFSADGNSLFFIRDSGIGAEVFAARRTDAKQYWWRNRAFSETRLTRDGTAKQNLQAVPGAKRISWVAGRGDLWSADLDGKNARRHLAGWSRPEYDWSPDGKWIAWAVDDDDFNRDVWIANAAGEGKPHNLSRHPDNDSNPVWSPDGKVLAFTGRRFDRETDIYYVYLSRADDEKDRRDRTLESALEKLDKARKKPAPATAPPKTGAPPPPGKTEVPSPASSGSGEIPDAPGDAVAQPDPKATAASPKPTGPALPETHIDFDDLSERIRRIGISDVTETNLFWSHDSKRLGFSGEVKGVKGTFTVTFPDKFAPVTLSTKQGSLQRWIARDDTLLWMVDGLPASLSKNSLRTFGFSARQTYRLADYRRAGFRQIWGTMRDTWYDENLNHLDWDSVRIKYEDAAAESPDTRTFDRVVAMMLGELNGSHLGFKSSAAEDFKPAQGWLEETAHLGVTFDRSFAGPGLKIETVLPNGPAEHERSELSPGETILEIDGTPVSREADLTSILNGPPQRDIRLKVAPAKSPNGDGLKAVPREVFLRPIGYTRARELMGDARLEKRRESIDKLSGGTIGYVSVARMAWDEFIRFEEEIFARGHGKEGLIVDVRDNGGGFTADHLLTVLTPAEHAVTVPRGGGPGYPQDRRVYASWSKPVVVLCNQNSFSNAEIFSHAIKELGRGKLVGVPTAGGVVSTGATGIRDLGTLRLPFRGWYRRSDGADMELNGAVPDFVVWPEPGDEAAGRDRQVEKAVEVLKKEIATAKAQPKPKLVPASERK